ncbi:Deoxyhypusine synthase [Caenorhabditis elegans]|uniref:Deoxyhypusine synthase n=1 Tax=Caenorhabditis elegans TaxID=6239 RepID=DHYS_CAEEL|nr:Deoxyhypusine synthase [Caenorhabditis elegans]Q9XXJ0.1 RecName: Full=Deoxyhypusine synthase; Short=DHS [Caenorhabditis elegans]CAA19451.1 Deoxyhypusine synthase [Caenorhabditis elegans]|eukprot:NP_496557.1 Deoxyhypusine synthase [Caenorhabditis elegans]
MSTNEAAASQEDIALAQGAVLVKSCQVPDGSIPIRGFDFSTASGPDFSLSAILSSYMSTGFQATHLAQAIQQVNQMLSLRDTPLTCDDDEKLFPYPEGRQKRSCTIFLGYTSNLVTSGLREVLRYCVQRNLVDCIVTSAGGIEEDLIKCLKPSYLGTFTMDGAKLRSNGMNRAGNVLIPNDNYCAFEDWLMPILDECLVEQEEKHLNWTPSKLIQRLGERIGDESSILYWAAKHRIPVFCPALTDGSLGDMLYFHSVKSSPGLRVDIVEDVRHINTIAVKSFKTGSIILGGGVVKHHINNANLMRNGADHTVYINTGQEFDGSDSGAQPDEAVSWGKVKPSAGAVKVHAEATLVFPLLVAETFAKHEGHKD